MHTAAAQASAAFREPGQGELFRMVVSMLLQRLLLGMAGVCLLGLVLFGMARLLIALSDQKDGYGMPVLAYHAVSDDTWGDASMFISPPAFERQMRTLHAKGYTSVTFSDLAAALPSRPAGKTVMITFDDGYDSVRTVACPILRKYGFRAVLFLPTGSLSGKPSALVEHAAEMAECIEFQSHTLTHPDLTQLDDAALRKELDQSATVMREWTNQPALAVSYPYGRTNDRVQTAASKSYAYGVMTRPGLYRTSTDPLRMPRLTQTPVIGRLLFALYIR